MLGLEHIPRLPEMWYKVRITFRFDFLGRIRGF